MQVNEALWIVLQRALGIGGTLMTAGVAATAPVVTKGCLHHTVIVSNRDGSDVLKVEGQIQETVASWIQIGSNISADGPVSFDGLYDNIRVSKVSGTGTATNAVIRSRY